MAWLRRLRNFFRPRRTRDDIDVELSFHVEERVDELIAAGMDEQQARRLARRQFGNYTLHRENTWRADIVGSLDSSLKDFHHGFRRLARDWRFSLAAILILAMGIGANTAIFSIVNSALFRNQAYRDPDRLVNIYQNSGENRAPMGISFPVYREMSEYGDIFSDVAAVIFMPLPVQYQEEDAVQTAVAEFATSNYLKVLGLRPFAGHWFEETADSSDSSDALIVIGYHSWKTRFHSDRSVIGRSLRVNGVPATVVGIGPEELAATPNAGIVTDFWLSISAVPSVGSEFFAQDSLRRRDFLFLCGRARLREGVSLGQARAAMDTLSTRLAADHPDEDPGLGITVLRAEEVRVHPQFDILLFPLTIVLLGAVGLVLLIACSNLSTLLLVRGSARSRDVSIRLALGASRGQIIRHLLVEDILLALAGGLGGYLLADRMLKALPSLLTSLDLPISLDFSLDYRVFGFTLLLSVVTGIGIGLVPALKSIRVNLVRTLRDEGQMLSTGRRWLTAKNALVTIQVAISFLLLAGTGALLLKLVSASSLDMGFAVDGVAILETDALYAGLEEEQSRILLEELRDRIGSMPGVSAVALSRGAPLSDFRRRALLIDGYVPDSGESSIPIRQVISGPGYFETLQIPLLSGRDFDTGDRVDTRPVAVINEAMALRYFGTLDTLGRSFRYQENQARVEIVGIAANIRREIEDEAPEPMFYVPFSQAESPPTTILARTSLPAAALLGSMQRELRSLNAALPVIRAQTMTEYLDEQLVAYKIVLALVGGLALYGLLLAILGLYSVVAYAVTSRFREIGVRMALGAGSGQVVGLVMRDVTALVCLGVAFGVGLTVSVLLILDRLAVSASEAGNITRPSISPITLALVAGVMIAIGAAAAFVPSRQAARIDPLRALRHE